MDKLLKLMDGKKRGIAAIVGVILTWCLKYDVMPEKWMELLMGCHGLFTAWAVGDAVSKKIKADAATASEEV